MATIQNINITDIQANETNVNWYDDGEDADALVLNRPIKEVSTIVNELIDDYNIQGNLDLSNVSQPIIPATDDSYDIGTTSKQWQDIYAEQFIESSSASIKKNVMNLSYNIDTVMSMRPVEYDKIKNNNHEIGFIAEEMNELIPEVVAKDEEGNAVGIDYARLVSVCVKAIQELKQEIEELKSK